MMQYITFMHANTEVQGSEEEWNEFFARAQASGLFSGGSAMGKRWTVGKTADTRSDSLAGYMRFDAENIEDLLELLEAHPIIRGGGTIEICEMPKSYGWNTNALRPTSLGRGPHHVRQRSLGGSIASELRMA